MTLYNDNDPDVCRWLRALIADGLIPPGVVDSRSITDIDPHELSQYTQCHFFAGIAGWPYALQLANWPTTKPVWTASCPCQPLSCAGQRKGHADRRHLWPAFYTLVAQCKPPTIFGEQVASKDGREWLAGIRADLEDLGYAVGAADLCAACQGAPHIRQRLFWVAHASSARTGRDTGATLGQEAGSSGARLSDGLHRSVGAVKCGTTGGMGDAQQPRRTQTGTRPEINPGSQPLPRLAPSGMGNTAPVRPQMWQQLHPELRREGSSQGCHPGNPWLNSIPHLCRDGKIRRIPASSEPVLQLLFDGLSTGMDPVSLAELAFPLTQKIPHRSTLLRALGNAIVPQVAAAFIQAANETLT